MNKKLIVLQDGNKECGSAALLSIIRYYGGDIPINKLVEMTNTTKEGTNFLNLKNASQKLGISVSGYKINKYEQLNELTPPFIAQFSENGYNHFVVIYKIKNEKVLIMNPAKGKEVIKKDEFLKKWTNNILVFVPYKKLSIFKENKYLTKLIIDLLIQNKKLILDITFFSLMFTAISCISVYYFQIVIDKVLNIEYFNLMIVTLVFVIIMLYKNLINYFRNELLIYLNQKLDLTLIINAYNKLVLLPYNYYKNKTTGEIISRINDITYIKSAISKLIVTVFLDFFICLVGGMILYNINSKLFLFLIIVTIAYLLVVLTFNKYVKTLVNINQTNNAKINSFLVESINGFESIKGLNLEKKMQNKFENLYVDSLNDNLIHEQFINAELFVKELINNVSSILIICLGAKLIMDNQLEIGSLITFNFLSSYYTEPLRNIVEFNKEYYYMKNSLRRANNLFEVDSLNLNTTNLEINGNIKINNLDFCYSNELILKNINFTIKKGEKVLLTGKSGTGKSTLLKILFKYYNIKRDTIIINNNDINDYTVMDIRKNITYISQNELIFNETIRNNIVLDREIVEEDFLKVTKLCCVNEIVKKDILGYDKYLEENAVNLSGGQRQRIILARALLNKSKILLVDEGLNELDINLERKILKNIFKLYKDLTIIIVSHRLNNIDLFDKMIELTNNSTIIKNKNNGGIYE